MKKILLFTVAAATAMAFTGCSQSSELADTESNNTETTQKAISFDTYLSKTTRADVSDATKKLQNDGFGLIAYYTSNNDYNQEKNPTLPNFMYNTKASGADWTYAPVRYWPNDDAKISFFAYAPYFDKGTTPNPTSGITSISENTSTSDPTITYTLGDITNSVDLLWGVSKKDKTTTNINLTRTNETVGFTFEHALAKFNIKAKTTSDIDKNTIVTIESIAIESSNLHKSGTINLHTGVWTPSENENINTTITKDKINTSISDPTGADLDIIKEPGILDGKGLTTNEANVIKDNASCYFIPATTPKITITIKYWVRTKDKKLALGITNVSQTIKKDITFTNSFEANKQYNLILGIGLTEIKFNAEVTDWDSEIQTNPEQVDMSVTDAIK